MISVGIMVQSCNDGDEASNENANFPEYAEKYGKVISKEFYNTVERLNKMGVDYSKANKSDAFKTQFYNDLEKIHPNIVNNMQQLDPVVFEEKIRILTDVQIKFIQRIIQDCRKSTSYQDLSDRLMSINKDIYAYVPEIEQERLFNVTAVLYYGMKEIQNLEKQGQMLRTPHNDLQGIRLKSGGESGGFGSFCSSFLATVWVIAIGDSIRGDCCRDCNCYCRRYYII